MPYLFRGNYCSRVCFDLPASEVKSSTVAHRFALGCQVYNASFAILVHDLSFLASIDSILLVAQVSISRRKNRKLSGSHPYKKSTGTGQTENTAIGCNENTSLLCGAEG